MVRNRGSRRASQVSVVTRVSNRARTPKEYPDYIDCSFSESEPSRLVPIPDIQSSSSRARGRGVRGACGVRGQSSVPQSTDSGRFSTQKRTLDGLPVNQRNSVVNDKQPQNGDYFPLFI